MDEERDEKLKEFLDEWKKEIQTKDDSNEYQYTTELFNKRPKYSTDDDSLTTEGLKKEKELSTFSAETTTRSTAVIGGPSLFILPSTDRATDNDKSLPNIPTITNTIITDMITTATTTSTVTLLDKLIADLDEINTVPFFDIQLPKEIAILIFNYLSVVDLCHCAMVSHSWRILAEDNLLWISICHRMGYSTDIGSTSTNIHWKTVVKELILHFRQVQQNWMERKCGISTYQPVNVGSLRTAAYLNKEILACYSTGECYLWSVLTKETISFPSSVTTPTCVTMNERVGCHSDANGNLLIFNMENQGQTYSHKEYSRIHTVAMAANNNYHAVALASGGYSTFSSLTVLCSKDCELSQWYSTSVKLPNPAEIRNFQIQKVTLLPSMKESDPFLVMYSTQSHLTLQSPFEPFSKGVHYLGEEGIICCINCYSLSTVHSSVVCGTLDSGYHQVRLFDLYSGVSKECYKGLTGKVHCVAYDKTKDSSFRIITGGEGKRINLYDSSSCYPVMRLSGVSSSVVSLQLEGWKVVSGSDDGAVAVWDLRIGQELWRTQDRHKVTLCEIDRDYLIVGHVPSHSPQVHTSNSSDLHSRYRGSVKVYDFSVDPTGYTNKLPSICSSSYDEPLASFYNLNLLYPYDIIQK